MHRNVRGGERSRAADMSRRKATGFCQCVTSGRATSAQPSTFPKHATCVLPQISNIAFERLPRIFLLRHHSVAEYDPQGCVLLKTGSQSRGFPPSYSRSKARHVSGRLSRSLPMVQQCGSPTHTCSSPRRSTIRRRARRLPRPPCRRRRRRRGTWAGRRGRRGWRP